MRIDVTAEHIAAGVRWNNCKCPVALAIRAAGYTEAHVGFATVWPQGFPFGGVFFTLPVAVSIFIHAFDSGEPVGPISFELHTH